MQLQRPGQTRHSDTDRERGRLRPDPAEGRGWLLHSQYRAALSCMARPLVARQGRIVEEFTAMEAAEERIMYAAVR